MDWIQCALFSMGLFGVLLLNRIEARAARREECDHRADILNIIGSIDDEIKDFHGRLCALEEKIKKE